MDKQNFTIGCLSLSAVMLLVGVFVLAAFETQRAEASGMIHTSGSYMLLTGKLAGTNELVYLIDSRSQKLVVYRLNEASRILERTQVIPLDEPESDKQDPKKRRP